MVKQIQEIDEYYHSDEDDDSDLFLAPTYYSVEEQIVIVACLMLLEQRYRVLKSMTPQRIVDEVEDIIDSLNVELTSTALDKIDSTGSAGQMFGFGIASMKKWYVYKNALPC